MSLVVANTAEIKSVRWSACWKRTQHNTVDYYNKLTTGVIGEWNRTRKEFNRKCSSVSVKRIELSKFYALENNSRLQRRLNCVPSFRSRTDDFVLKSSRMRESNCLYSRLNSRIYSKNESLLILGDI